MRRRRPRTEQRAPETSLLAGGGADLDPSQRPKRPLEVRVPEKKMATAPTTMTTTTNMTTITMMMSITDDDDDDDRDVDDAADDYDDDRDDDRDF